MLYLVATKYFKPNGCGSKGKELKYRISYALTPNFFWKGVCDNHDVGYFVGGCKEIDSSARFTQDILMLDRIEVNIKQKNFFLRALMTPIKHTYFRMVRKFGQDAFKWFSTPEEWKHHLIDNEVQLVIGYKKLKGLEIYEHFIRKQ